MDIGGIHYSISKEFNIKNKKENLLCEIQVRTVLQDAWAIQSHVFGYKKKTEGDADILKQAMSGILDNCEMLWELVKRDANGDKNVSADEVTMIYQDTSRKVKTMSKDNKEIDIENLVSENKINEIEDILESEFQKIKESWTHIYSTNPNYTQAEEMLEKMESLMNIIKAVGLLSIKYQKIDILKKVFDKLEKIASLSELGSGYKNVLSIPSALLHNSFYYFGVYSLLKLDGKAEDFIINQQIERDYNGKVYYTRIWENSSFMAPEVVNGAEKTFNRLLAEYPKNDNIRNIINVDEEEFRNLACQFNMLFCFKAAQEAENGKSEPWAFPNFGRFYSNRIDKFVGRIKNKSEYQTFITKALKEDITTFGNKFNSRIEKMTKRGLGSGYFWSAHVRWED